MDDETLKAVAGQLRKPNGEFAVKISGKMNQSNALMNLSAIEFLSVKPGEHILEIGMANGFFVKDILSSDHTVKYTGCDFSEEMIKEAITLNAAYIASEQAQFICNAVNSLPFSENSFDKIFTVNTLYFWEEPNVSLQEIRRVLKPGGKFTVSIRPDSVMQVLPFTAYGFRLFSKEELLLLLSKNGFTTDNILEQAEPDQEINGRKYKMSYLHVTAGLNK